MFTFIEGNKVFPSDAESFAQKFSIWQNLYGFPSAIFVCEMFFIILFYLFNFEYYQNTA